MHINVKSHQLKMIIITSVLLLSLILQSIQMINSFIHTYDENIKYHRYNNKYLNKNYQSVIFANLNNNQIPIKRSKISINNTNDNRSNIKQQQQQRQMKYTSITKYENQSIKSWSITDTFNSTTLKLLFDIKVNKFNIILYHYY